MSGSDSSANRNLDASKSPITPSHEAIGSGHGAEESSLDKSAMESAKRAEHRIHNDEETTPGNTIFSK